MGAIEYWMSENPGSPVEQTKIFAQLKSSEFWTISGLEEIVEVPQPAAGTPTMGIGCGQGTYRLVTTPIPSIHCSFHGDMEFARRNEESFQRVQARDYLLRAVGGPLAAFSLTFVWMLTRVRSPPVRGDRPAAS